MTSMGVARMHSLVVIGMTATNIAAPATRSPSRSPSPERCVIVRRQADPPPCKGIHESAAVLTRHGRRGRGAPAGPPRRAVARRGGDPRGGGAPGVRVEPPRCGRLCRAVHGRRRRGERGGVVVGGAGGGRGGSPRRGLGAPSRGARPPH